MVVRRYHSHSFLSSQNKVLRRPFMSPVFLQAHPKLPHYRGTRKGIRAARLRDRKGKLSPLHEEDKRNVGQGYPLLYDYAAEFVGRSDQLTGTSTSSSHEF